MRVEINETRLAMVIIEAGYMWVSYTILSSLDTFEIFHYFLIFLVCFKLDQSEKHNQVRKNVNQLCTEQTVTQSKSRLEVIYYVGELREKGI